MVRTLVKQKGHDKLRGSTKKQKSFKKDVTRKFRKENLPSDPINAKNFRKRPSKQLGDSEEKLEQKETNEEKLRTDKSFLELFDAKECSDDENQLSLSIEEGSRDTEEGEQDEVDKKDLLCEDDEEDLAGSKQDLDSNNVDSDDQAQVCFTGDLSAIKDRMAENARLLANWRERRESKREISRSSVVQQLTQDAALYYGFSLELAQYFMELFNPVECIAFFESVDASRPITLRTNMIHTRRRDLAKLLIARGCNVDPIGDWTKVGLKVLDSSVPVGATPEYCAGHYMIQGASSFIPVMALAPQPGELILDMAASPGGKSTYIGQLMKNSGVLFCNDSNKERNPALVANLHRMGITNAIVMNFDGATLPGKLPPVDRVLLDAPCTGLGLLSRDPSVKTKRTVAEFIEQAAIQKKLLVAAVDLCNAASPTGGYIVYSTCSLSIEENEEVIEYILKARHVKVVAFGFPDDIWSCGLSRFKEKRFHPSLKLARRIYPHLHNMDGFFVCKLKKLSNNIPKREPKDRRKSNIYVKTWSKEQWTPELLNDVAEVPCPS